MMNGDNVIIFGDGSTSRDFCFIDNVIQINILAALADDASKNNIFNVALGNRTSLKVLHDENDKGEWIFEQFYAKNSIEAMLKFLDEESSFLEELKIMKSLFSLAFIKAFFKTL